MSRCQILLGLFIALASLPSLAAEEDHAPPVTAQDVQILHRARELLPDEGHWNRHDTRECPPEAPTLSLFCALQKASIEVLGTYDHRRAALQEVRFAIEKVSGGREFEHRLMDFNNLPETSLADIHRVLSLAADQVEARLKALPGASPGRTPGK